MTPFVTLEAIAAPLPVVNIDTDKIIGATFLKTTSKAGLGHGLFDSWRRTSDGTEISGFILNRHPWRSAQILVARENFGCGSSREHAPWALLDYGFRAIIAPSFADIFHNNCLKNGILPICLPAAAVEELLAEISVAVTATLDIDLPRQTVMTTSGSIHYFDISAGSKQTLLSGADEIAKSLMLQDKIDAFEARYRIPLDL